MRIPKSCFTSIALLIVLAGCGGGQSLVSSPAGPPPAPGGTTTGSSNPQPPSAADSLADQIKRLEQSGDLPRLDRSSDIAGPDRDADQVRDDIQAWINARPLSEERKRAALQFARALQQTLLIDPTDAQARNNARQGVTDANECLYIQFKGEFSAYDRLSSQLEGMTANTPERARRYARYNRALSGSAWSMPEGNTCQ